MFECPDLDEVRLFGFIPDSKLIKHQLQECKLELSRISEEMVASGHDVFHAIKCHICQKITPNHMFECVECEIISCSYCLEEKVGQGWNGYSATDDILMLFN